MLSEFETARIFAESLYLKVIMFIRIITSGTGLICLAVLECNRKKFVAHKSLKILLNLHGFWTFMLCLSAFSESVLNIHAHFTLNSPSDLLVSPHQCLLRAIPGFFGICGSVSSLLAMSAERWEASKKLSTYEFSSRYQWLKFVAVHFSLMAVWLFMDIVMYDFPTRVAHCTIVSVGGRDIQSVVVAIFFCSELFLIYFYMKLLRQNEILHDSIESLDMSLSERYQLFENISVLRLLLPVVISHTSLTIFAAIGFFIFESAGFRTETYPIFEDTINIVYLQGIFMPLIFLLRYRNKRTQQTQIFKTNRSTGNDFISVYDREITKGW